MAALTPQAVDTDGLNPTFAAAAGGGDTFAPVGAVTHWLVVKNGGGSSMNVIIDDPTTADPGAATQFNPDVTVAVTNGQERWIKIDLVRYKNPSTGVVNIAYSAVTSVTVGVFYLS